MAVIVTGMTVVNPSAPPPGEHIISNSLIIPFTVGSGS